MNRLLTQGLALWSEKLVHLTSLSQDGGRIRASTGASSFRRLETLQRLLDEVRVRIVQLKRKIDSSPEASTRRQRAARERVLREREERIAKALGLARTGSRAGRGVSGIWCSSGPWLTVSVVFRPRP
jgi:hypothetical protein